MDHLLTLVALGVGLAAIVVAALGKKAGLVLAAADVVAVQLFPLLALLGPRVITGDDAAAAPSPGALAVSVVWPLAWTAVLVAVGFGFEPLLRRLGVGIYRLDRQVMLGAAIGMIVALFATAGMSMMVFGAFLGALAGGLFNGVYLKRAATDALGSLLGLFGADGIRLVCTLSIVGLVVRS
ncbi:MAG: DUF456 domain-containing protein [Candidatus Sericytochromatia bacterium]|nr:DUF456 domain-containing protein [Candidatus Tanganyikabacteria bacterium]